MWRTLVQNLSEFVPLRTKSALAKPCLPGGYNEVDDECKTAVSPRMFNHVVFLVFQTLSASHLVHFYFLKTRLINSDSIMFTITSFKKCNYMVLGRIKGLVNHGALVGKASEEPRDTYLANCGGFLGQLQSSIQSFHLRSVPGSIQLISNPCNKAQIKARCPK